MVENLKDELVEEIMQDSLLYMKLFNELLSNLGQKKFMRIITWLIVIEEYNNPSLSELGGMLNLTKAQMTIKTDWLTELGLIERVPDKRDCRIIRLALTPEGHNFLKNSQNTVIENMNQLFAPLDLKRVEELKKSVETIKNVVLEIQDVKSTNNAKN